MAVDVLLSLGIDLQALATARQQIEGFVREANQQISQPAKIGVDTTSIDQAKQQAESAAKEIKASVEQPLTPQIDLAALKAQLDALKKQHGVETPPT